MMTPASQPAGRIEDSFPTESSGILRRGETDHPVQEKTSGRQMHANHVHGPGRKNSSVFAESGPLFNALHRLLYTHKHATSSDPSICTYIHTYKFEYITQPSLSSDCRRRLHQNAHNNPDPVRSSELCRKNGYRPHLVWNDHQIRLHGSELWILSDQIFFSGMISTQNVCSTNRMQSESHHDDSRKGLVLRSRLLWRGDERLKGLPLRRFYE